MKKLLISALVLLTAVVATGQGKFGFVGGYTSARMSLSEEIKSLSIKSAPGFNLGIAYYYPLPLGFGVQPQMVYTSKSSDVDDLVNYKVEYLEVPVQLQWGIDLIVIKPYVFVEPFAGCAISGHFLDLQSSKYSKMNLDSRLEYGFSVGAGLMVARHVQISFKYFWNQDNSGLSKDIVPETVVPSVDKRFKGLVLSAGVFF